MYLGQREDFEMLLRKLGGSQVKISIIYAEDSIFYPKNRLTYWRAPNRKGTHWRESKIVVKYSRLSINDNSFNVCGS